MVKNDVLDRIFPPDEKLLHLTGLMEEQCELLNEVIIELKKFNERVGVLASALLKHMETTSEPVKERSKEQPKRAKKAS